MGLPVIECFYGGEAAGFVERDGPAAGFAFAQDQLAALFGNQVRGMLKPLLASNWGQIDHIGGAYSYARPGRMAARRALARPFENRIFFAGEATSSVDFSTAHGAHDSGVRAANEALAAL
jgi:monoamine oxidase